MKNKIKTPRERFLAQQKHDKIKIRSLQIAVFVAFVGLWELTTATKITDSFFTSSPSRICFTLYSMITSGEIWAHVGITLGECLIGFLLSTVIGVAIAITLWWSDTLRRVCEPYLVVLNALPKIALGPIIIIWVGTGTTAIVTMTFLICIIVTVMSALSAFLSCDEGKIFLLRSMNASKAQILRLLVLPHSIPAFISLLKINVGLAWVGTIMGEYLVSGAGLGYLIIYGGQVFKIDLVMTATVVLCLLAAAMYLLVALLEKLSKRYK